MRNFEKCRLCKHLDYYFRAEPCIRCVDNDHFESASSEEMEERYPNSDALVTTKGGVMVYCDDCILRDICGAEGKYDESMTFCADKDRFIEKSNGSKDRINPDHYKKECSLECIEAMELIFGGRAVLDFCVCNAWKYIWRWKNKNGVEDLHKADWYVNKANEIKHNYATICYDGEISRMKSYISTEIDKWEAEHEEPTV